MSIHHSTTYARATLEYDTEHERALLGAITQAIFDQIEGERLQCGGGPNRRGRRGPADGAGMRPRNVAVGDTLARGNPQDRRRPR